MDRPTFKRFIARLGFDRAQMAQALGVTEAQMQAHNEMRQEQPASPAAASPIPKNPLDAA